MTPIIKIISLLLEFYYSAHYQSDLIFYTRMVLDRITRKEAEIMNDLTLILLRIEALLKQIEKNTRNQIIINYNYRTLFKLNTNITKSVFYIMKKIN